MDCFFLFGVLEFILILKWNYFFNIFDEFFFIERNGYFWCGVILLWRDRVFIIFLEDVKGER